MYTFKNKLNFKKGNLFGLLLLVALLSFSFTKTDISTFNVSNPFASLAGSMGGSLSIASLKAATGVDISPPSISNPKICKITGFEFILVPKKQDPISRKNNSSQFDEETINIIGQVKKGDLVYVEDIKCTCPGDEEERKLNSLEFRIK